MSVVACVAIATALVPGVRRTGVSNAPTARRELPKT